MDPVFPARPTPPVPHAEERPLSVEEIYAGPAHEKELHTDLLRIAAGVLLFTCVPSLIAPFVYAVLRAAAPDADGVLLRWGLQIVLLYLLALPLSLLAIGRPKGGRADGERMDGAKFLCYFCIFETAGIGGSLLSRLFDLILTSLTGRESADSLTEAITGTPPWMILTAVCLIGPVAEELLFRRAIIGRLSPYGEKSAILFSALLFGLAHENFGQLFYAFAGGLLLGYVYVRTRRVLYTCLLHVLFNFCGSFIPILLTQTEEGSLSSLLLTAGYAAFEYMLALAGLVLLLVFYRTRVFRKAEKPLPGGQRARLYFGNVGVILLLLWEIYATASATLDLLL